MRSMKIRAVLTTLLSALMLPVAAVETPDFCLDMFREMFLATGLAKVRENDASAVNEITYMIGNNNKVSFH